MRREQLGANHPGRRPGHADAAVGVDCSRTTRRGGSPASSSKDCRHDDARPASALLAGARCGCRARAAAAAELRGTGDLGLVVERATGSRAGRRDDAAHGRSAASRAWAISRMPRSCSRATSAIAYRLRPRWRPDQDRPARAADRPARGAGRQLRSAAPSPTTARWSRSPNYEPGGVRVFDAGTLAPVADIPAAEVADGKRSKVVGPRRCARARASSAASTTPARSGSPTLARSGEPRRSTRFPDVGKLPYDGNVTPDGRHYLAGLFGEDGARACSICGSRREGRAASSTATASGEEPLPVYKMPHLRRLGGRGRHAVPAGGRPSRAARRSTRATWQEVGPRRRRTVSRCSRWRGRTAARSGSISRIRSTTRSRSIDAPTLQGGRTLAARTGGAAHGIHPARRARSGSRCATPIASTSTTPRRFAQLGHAAGREARAASSSPRARTGSGSEPWRTPVDARRSRLLDGFQRDLPLVAAALRGDRPTRLGVERGAR